MHAADSPYDARQPQASSATGRTRSASWHKPVPPFDRFLHAGPYPYGCFYFGNDVRGQPWPALDLGHLPEPQGAVSLGHPRMRTTFGHLPSATLQLLERRHESTYGVQGVESRPPGATVHIRHSNRDRRARSTASGAPHCYNRLFSPSINPCRSVHRSFQAHRHTRRSISE